MVLVVETEYHLASGRNHFYCSC